MKPGSLALQEDSLPVELPEVLYCHVPMNPVLTYFIAHIVLYSNFFSYLPDQIHPHNGLPGVSACVLSHLSHV